MRSENCFDHDYDDFSYDSNLFHLDSHPYHKRNNDDDIFRTIEAKEMHLRIEWFCVTVTNLFVILTVEVVENSSRQKHLCSGWFSV